MKSYYHLIDNQWDDGCPSWPLTEEGLADAISYAQEERTYQLSKPEGVDRFMPVLLKITTEAVSF